MKRYYKCLKYFHYFVHFSLINKLQKVVNSKIMDSTSHTEKSGSKTPKLNTNNWALYSIKLRASLVAKDGADVALTKKVKCLQMEN